MDSADLQSRLGRAISAHRRTAGLTQEQLAEAVGVSTEWISQVERGLGFKSLDLLVSVAAALHVQASELLGAALDEQAGRASVQGLVAVARELPDDAVGVLVDVAQSLRRRWPSG